MIIFKKTEENYRRLFTIIDIKNSFEENSHALIESPEYTKNVIAFLHQSQVDAIKEFVEGLLPEKILEKIQIMDESTGKTEMLKIKLSLVGKIFNQIVSEIQERINEKLKEIKSLK